MGALLAAWGLLVASAVGFAVVVAIALRAGR